MTPRVKTHRLSLLHQSLFELGWGEYNGKNTPKTITFEHLSHEGDVIGTSRMTESLDLKAHLGHPALMLETPPGKACHGLFWGKRL